VRETVNSDTLSWTCLDRGLLKLRTPFNISLAEVFSIAALTIP